jgi:hypothetical protein
MDLRDATQKAGQILDEERISPTVTYGILPTAGALVVALAPLLQQERGSHNRQVRERPELFQLKSTNFDLLCALLDQVPHQDRPALIASISSRIANRSSYKHRPGPTVEAGSWRKCSSELPLLAEFLVRRADKELFLRAIGEAAPSPGLTLLLIHLEEMVALNFTLFTDHEYTQFPKVIASISGTLGRLAKQPKPAVTKDANTIYHVLREIPPFCESLLELCRKAKFLYVKGSLMPGMNLEVNQDKNSVRTFLEKLGFTKVLIESLNEAEKLYRESATPFELKSSMGHLRSFLEGLHVQASSAAHKKFGGTLATKWGEALLYLRNHDILTLKEEQFAAQFYALMSDTAVHRLVAEREYARLMRNMSIEYGLLLLTKLDKLGLK